MHDQDTKPTPSLAGIVYGEIVYWGTLLGTVISVIGTVICFVTKANYISPTHMISSIWLEKSVNEIWTGAVGFQPNEHWYLGKITTGDGLTCFGLAMGVFVVIPAMLASAILLCKDKNVFFGSLALLATVITIVSMVGLIRLPIG